MLETLLRWMVVVCVCVRARVCACVRACVHACMRVCELLYVCMYVCMELFTYGCRTVLVGAKILMTRLDLPFSDDY